MVRERSGLSNPARCQLRFRGDLGEAKLFSEADMKKNFSRLLMLMILLVVTLSFFYTRRAGEEEAFASAVPDCEGRERICNGSERCLSWRCSLSCQTSQDKEKMSHDQAHVTPGQSISVLTGPLLVRGKLSL